MGLLLFLAVTLSTPALPPPSLASEVMDEPSRKWWEGPVHYILKIREEERYRRLKTDAEREVFIRQFWEALDPSPGTPVNERRQVFWDRVARVDQLFRDSTTPGWKTDRGKIYILLGPPHEASRYGNGDVWTYRGLPIPGTPPEIRLAFYRGRDGAYHLSSRPLTYTAPIVTRRGPLGDDALSLMADVASVQVIKERILMPESTGRSATDYFFGGLVSERQFLFQLAGDGTTFVTLAAAIPMGQFLESEKKSAPPELLISLTATDVVKGQVVLRLQERMSIDPGWDAGTGRPLPFEVGFPLPPGDYRIEYTLIEAGSRRGGVFSETLTVPDFRRTLSLSDVTLAHASAPTPSNLPPELGSALPFPDAAKSFHRDEKLHFAFQVYNAGKKDELANLDVEYDFFYRSGSEWWLVGNPVRLSGVEGESLGYSLPLAGWPDGDYRLKVKVTDNVTGSTAGREAEFKVQSGVDPIPPVSPHQEP